jgi:hypothetical protein
MSEIGDIKNRVPVIGNYYMTADQYGWVLVEALQRISKKDGETYEDFEVVGYYPTVASLCKAALRKCLLDGVGDGELKTLQEVIRKSEEIERTITDAIGDKF